MNIYVLGYKTKVINHQGVYHFELKDKKLKLRNSYLLEQKPGALVKINNQIIVSTKKNDDFEDNNFVIYEISEDGSLVEKERIKQPYYFSYLSLSIDKKYLLSASFYEGLDAIYQVLNLKIPIYLNKHSFEKPTKDTRQQECHSHFIEMAPFGNLIFSTDLGSDHVYAYNYSENEISCNKDFSFRLEAESGPRLMAFGKRHKNVYLLNEIKNSIDVFLMKPKKLEKIQEISTVIKDLKKDNSPAAIKISPDLTVLGISNRGEDTIVFYKIEPVFGKLEEIERICCGKTPRDFIFLSDELILVAAQDENSLELYEFKDNVWILLDTAYILSPVSILCEGEL